MQTSIQRNPNVPIGEPARHAGPRSTDEVSNWMTERGPGPYAGKEKLLQLLSTKALRNFRNSLGAGGTTGGYSVPSLTVLEAFEMALTDASAMRSVATIERREHAIQLNVPILDDGTTEGAIVRMGQDAGTADPTFAARAFFPHKYSSKRVIISNTLLRDVPSMGPQIAIAEGLRVGRIQNRKFTIGTGASEPRGIVNAATLGVTAAGASSISGDEIDQLEGSLEVEFAEAPTAGFMMHRNTYKGLMRLKDANGHYLYERRRPGEPPHLDGMRVVMNSHMPQMASGNRSVIFGDLSKYRIVDAGEMRQMIYTENYIENDQTAYEAFMESDGNIVDVASHPAIKYLVHP